MDTTQRCGGCRFWEPHKGIEARDYPGWGVCGRIHMDDASEYPDQESQEIALAQDGSGFFAAVRCKADFGCVLFKAKGER